MILPQTEIGPRREDLVAFVSAAEDSGFEFVSIYDHVLGAGTATRPGWAGAYDANDQFHEPFVLFGFLAGLTGLELATGVLILPQRQTALVAKQAAEIDILTNGRFRLGVGIGWNDVEYEALGVDFGRRAERYEEQIDVLRLLWTHDVVDFRGQFHRIDSAGILPRPVQRPIPIWMGGGTGDRVLERIGRLGDGWLALTPPGYGLEEAWDVVIRSALAAGRKEDSIGIQGRVEAQDDPDHARLKRQLRRWEDFGPATHVAFSGLHAGRSPAEHIEFVRRAGEIVFG